MAKKKQSRQNSESSRLASVFDDPPRKNVLLLSCMDQRLLDDTVRFMNALNLQNRYDQVALAGGAMGANLLPDPRWPSSKRWEDVFFLHLKSAIDVLHRPIKDVFLLEHLDCGAYKYLHPTPAIQKDYRNANRDEMIELHRTELKAFTKKVTVYITGQKQQAYAEFNAAQDACEACDEGKGDAEKKCWGKVKDLAEEKAEAWSEIRVSYFVMDLLGVVRQLDVGEEERDTL